MVLIKDTLPELHERVLFYAPCYGCITLGYMYLKYDYFHTFQNQVLGRECDASEVICWWPLPKYERSDL